MNVGHTLWHTPLVARVLLTRRGGQVVMTQNFMNKTRTCFPVVLRPWRVLMLLRPPIENKPHALLGLKLQEPPVALTCVDRLRQSMWDTGRLCATCAESGMCHLSHVNLLWVQEVTLYFYEISAVVAKLAAHEEGGGDTSRRGDLSLFTWPPPPGKKETWKRQAAAPVFLFFALHQINIIFFMDSSGNGCLVLVISSAYHLHTWLTQATCTVWDWIKSKVAEKRLIYLFHPPGGLKYLIIECCKKKLLHL